MLPVERALSTTFCISQGDRNCPFLIFTGLPWELAGHDEIRLPAEEGRRLQNIDDRGNLIQRRIFMHVRQYRHADLIAHLRERLQASLEPRTAETGARGAVRLVERRFEDEGDFERGGHFLEPSGDIDHQGFALDDAGTGNQEERAILPDLEGRQLHALMRWRGPAATRPDIRAPLLQIP